MGTVRNLYDEENGRATVCILEDNTPEIISPEELMHRRRIASWHAKRSGLVLEIREDSSAERKNKQDFVMTLFLVVVGLLVLLGTQV